jgi:hypothetical protein
MGLEPEALDGLPDDHEPDGARAAVISS